MIVKYAFKILLEIDKLNTYTAYCYTKYQDFGMILNIISSCLSSIALFILELIQDMTSTQRVKSYHIYLFSVFITLTIFCLVGLVSAV